MIKEHQQKHPRIFSKYKEGAYIKGSFHGGSNIYHNLIKCDDKIVIPPIMQSYILHWYHYYLLHPGIDGTEAMIRQNLYWTGVHSLTLSFYGMHWKPFIYLMNRTNSQYRAEFIFQYNRSNHTSVYRYQYYTVNFRYKNVTQSAFFFYIKM